MPRPTISPQCPIQKPQAGSSASNGPRGAGAPLLKQHGASRPILPPTPQFSLLPHSREPPPPAHPPRSLQEQHQPLHPVPSLICAPLGWAPQLPAATGISSLPRHRQLCPGKRLPGSERVQGSALLPAPPKVSHLSVRRATRERRPATFLSWREGRSCVHVEI